jgi:hypothetical protein
MKTYILLLTILTILFCGVAAAQEVEPAPDSIKVKKINPSGALFRSAFIPGWGQFYNKKYIKATVIAGLEIYLINGVYTNWKDANRHKDNFTSADDDPEYQAVEFAEYERALDRRGAFSWFLAAAIFYSMFDAYVDAHLSNFDQEDKAFEVYIGPGKQDEIEITLTFNIQ